MAHDEELSPEFRRWIVAALSYAAAAGGDAELDAAAVAEMAGLPPGAGEGMARRAVTAGLAHADRDDRLTLTPEGVELARTLGDG